jgi:hypothetical protein
VASKAEKGQRDDLGEWLFESCLGWKRDVHRRGGGRKVVFGNGWWAEDDASVKAGDCEKKDIMQFLAR